MGNKKAEKHLSPREEFKRKVEEFENKPKSGKLLSNVRRKDVTTYYAEFSYTADGIKIARLVPKPVSENKTKSSEKKVFKKSKFEKQRELE